MKANNYGVVCAWGKSGRGDQSSVKTIQQSNEQVDISRYFCIPTVRFTILSPVLLTIRALIVRT